MKDSVVGRHTCQSTHFNLWIERLLLTQGRREQCEGRPRVLRLCGVTTPPRPTFLVRFPQHIFH